MLADEELCREYFEEMARKIGDRQVVNIEVDRFWIARSPPSQPPYGLSQPESLQKSPTQTHLPTEFTASQQIPVTDFPESQQEQSTEQTQESHQTE